MHMQVTPILGILREYYNRRKQGKNSPEDVAQNVYMSWTCRSGCELQMLDADLLKVAAATEEARQLP